MTGIPPAKRGTCAGAPRADLAHFRSARVIEIDSDVPGFRRAAQAALDAAAVTDGHLAIQLVDEARIQALNRESRGKEKPTDVLSFPIDEGAPVAGPRELGDVVICPEQTRDLAEAVVHGVLHLCGYDHETDGGEMLALQDRVMESLWQGGARAWGRLPDGRTPASRRCSTRSSAPRSRSPPRGRRRRAGQSEG